MVDLTGARVDPTPFPHVLKDSVVRPDAYATMKANFPAEKAFSHKRYKLDLALTDEVCETLHPIWRELREAFRAHVPELVALFREPVSEKYRWLLGDLADEVLARGFTTTDGRLMGRAPGYTLEPHTDSSQWGITCLLYCSTPEDGDLCLYEVDRTPAVRTASTYYAGKIEGVTVSVAKRIAVRENRFVAFLNGPRSIHGVSRSEESATPWRFAYQCHVLPAGLDMRALYDRLAPEQQARWTDIISRVKEHGSVPTM